MSISPPPRIWTTSGAWRGLYGISMESCVRPDSEVPYVIPLDEHTFTGMVTMTFMTRHGPCDISFVPDGTTGFEDLERGAQVIERRGVKIPVASVADIVRSKRAAGREKDAAHLRTLLAFLRENEDGTNGG